ADRGIDPDADRHRLHLCRIPAERSDALGAVHLAQDARSDDPDPGPLPARLPAQVPAAAFPAGTVGLAAACRGVEPSRFLFHADRIAAHRPDRGVGYGEGSDDLADRWNPAACRARDQQGDRRHVRRSSRRAGLHDHRVVAAARRRGAVPAVHRAPSDGRPDAAIPGAGRRAGGHRAGLAGSSSSKLSIASAIAATPAPVTKVAALPSRSHSSPAPRLASSEAMPVTNQKAPKLVARSCSGALSAIIREKMPCVSAICAPHRLTPRTRPAMPLLLASTRSPATSTAMPAIRIERGLIRSLSAPAG